jgi:THO complex subunit 1
VIEPGAIFTLLEQLMEGSTVPDCEAVFGWMELQRSSLASPALWARGKLILLRTCNDLTRRLSRAAHPVLCGRVLLLLAAVFPLSERSAVNIQGLYNRANVTAWEPPAAAAAGLSAGGEAEEGEVINADFYDAFWGLQHYFNHMPSALPPLNWARFAKGAELLLDAFEADPLPEERSSAAGALPLGVAAPGTGQKYLTSSKLLRLELRDPAFRRALLLQLCLLLRFARGPPDPNPPLRGKAPDEAARLAERAEACLAAVPPAGKAVAAAVAAAMDRDRQWVAWKAASCKPFERPPAPEVMPEAPPAPAAPPPGMRKRRVAAAPSYAVRLGSAELDRLWNTHAALGEAARSADRGPPEHLEFLEPIREQLDPAFCAENDIEPQYKRMNDKVFCWKALRLVTRAALGAFAKATEREGGSADIEAVARVLYGLPPPAKEAGAKEEKDGDKEDKEEKEEKEPGVKAEEGGDAVMAEAPDAEAPEAGEAGAEVEAGEAPPEAAPEAEAEPPAAEGEAEAAAEEDALAAMEAEAEAAEAGAAAPEAPVGGASRKRSHDEAA